MTDLDSIFLRGKKAYVSGEFEKAKVIFDSLIIDNPRSAQAHLARYLRARGFEDGAFGRVELDMALNDFRHLHEISEQFGSDGTLGVARVLFEKNKHLYADEVQKLCHSAIKQDENVKAMMLLGLLNEEVFAKPSLAAKWYLSAYRRGLPWGLRYYARLQAKMHHRIRSLLAHGIASLTSPILVARYGVRSPLK